MSITLPSTAGARLEAARNGGTPFTRAGGQRPPRRPASSPEALAAGRRQRALIASRIRHARHRLGLSQARLAEQIGVKQHRVSEWEAGRSYTPSPLYLERLADALGERVDYFYGGPSSHPHPLGLDPHPFEASAPCPEVAELLSDDDRYIPRLVGANIVCGRELLGLSQRELAIKLEIDRRQLSEWERGLWQPRGRNLLRLAEALAQPLSFFYTPEQPGAASE